MPRPRYRHTEELLPVLLIALAAVVGFAVFVAKVETVGAPRAVALGALWAFGAVCMSIPAILAIGAILA